MAPAPRSKGCYPAAAGKDYRPEDRHPDATPDTNRDGGTPEKAQCALVEETDGKVDVWSYAWVPLDVAAFEREFELASSLGAQQILFWEADYIDDRANTAELKLAMSARS